MNRAFYSNGLGIRLLSSRHMHYIVLFIAFTPLNLFSQLKLGSKAPEIAVSNWITKKNVPIKIEKKFIVLDFWATWCAPCLAALPHMNKLQRKFENHKELVFLSLTDEPPQKVKKILPRFHFESVIVSDTTGKTQELYNIKSLPTVFLIDKMGYVRWIGDPQNLTDDVIDRFLKNKGLLDLPPNQSIEQSRKSSQIDSLYKAYRGIFDNNEIPNYVSVTKPSNQHSGKFAKKISSKIYNVCQIGVKISSLLSELLYCNERQIKLPNELKEKTISYCFKRDNISSKEEGDSLLLWKVLQELNLNLVISDELTDVIILEVSDSNKLNNARTIVDSHSINGSSLSDDLKVVSIYNSSLNVLERELNKALSDQVEIKNLNSLHGYYNITLSNRSFDDIKQSLHVYGLSMKIKRKLVKKYQVLNL